VIPRTILIVEDNPITRKRLCQALDTKEYRLLEAADGASALAQFATGEPDLVLLDVALPDTDGFALLKQMRAQPRGRATPILACAAAYSSFDDTRAHGADFDDILPKPIDPAMLLQVVRGYLASRPTATDAFGTGLRALVVDDDPIQLKLLSYRLSEVGFEIILAADGQAALAQARTHRPHCIVSDVMMPRLDGFGLCKAIRGEPALAHTLVVLATNSYVEPADRDLAWRLGADDLVVRTPDLAGIFDALKQRIDSRTPARQIEVQTGVAGDNLERERNRRTIHQLEKQVGLHARQAQRSATLVTELSVVNGISSALVNGLDIGTAMDTVLAACLDAGGVSLGALYLIEADGAVASHTFGGGAGPGLNDLFGRVDLILGMVRGGKTVHLDRAELDGLGLPAATASSVLIVPLVHRERPLGALLLASNQPRTDQTERVAFAETVANQLALAFVLATSFELRAASEAHARREANLLSSILDTIGDGVAAVGRDGQLTHWNSAATTLVGIGAIDREARAPGARRLYSADGTTPVAAEDMPLVRALRGERVDNADLVMRRVDSPDSVWLSVNARPSLDERHQISGAVAVFRDVTQQKKAQAQLMVSDRMASVGMLAAGVAHEINNPLAALLANLQFLDEDLRAHLEELGAVSPRLREIQEALSEAQVASDRVRLIVKDLKIFSRADEDKRGPVDVERVLESSLRMAWNEVRHRARLIKEFGSVPPVHANEARLGQVFLNLIVNAAHAIAEGRADAHRITAATREHDGWVVIEIRDTGPGIPPEVLAQLFTPFFTTKPVGQGTGLGLVICERIIRDLGGRITVDSKVGEGTVVTVWLRPHRGSDKPEVARAAVPKATRRGHVLVVDDDPATGRSVKRALGFEHDVVLLEDARQALAAVAAGSVFDIILCDLMMPLMTGAEFFHQLEKLRPGLAERVVFLTGGAFTTAARTFLDQVANPRIDKPFDVAHLRSIVNERVR
jgi:PAS domain S-box-containing protein